MLAAARTHLARAMANANPTPRAPACPPFPCQEDFAYRANFLGCSSTFIPAPSCSITNRDQRLWVRNLDQVREQRSRLNDAKWDPYAHHNARQGFLQFLASDMVFRKDNYARPVATLEEATCFQAALRDVVTDGGNHGCPPGPDEEFRSGAGPLPASP
jgi:hypothetical protein